MISGQTSTGTIRKKDLENQKIPATGFTKQYFAHKATAGETGINLNSLTTPPEMSANGFVNPPAGQLASANLLFFKNNLKLTSSLRGDLQLKFSYDIAGSTQINFIGFTALEGEIFTGTIDYSAMTGLKVVDATATPYTGTVAAGTADFNIGQTFQTNKYPTTQIGAVTVYVDGVQYFRNPNNSSSFTNANGYYELDNGGGSFSVIRFNQADPDNIRNVCVIPTGLLSERPDGSMMTVIESIQGQLNNIAPYVATLAGLTTAQVLGSTPTNVDLKAFGDRVLALEQNRARIDQSNTWTAAQAIPGSTTGSGPISSNVGAEVKAVSTVIFDQTSPVLNTVYDVPSLSITLDPGNWDIFVMTSIQAAFTLGTATSLLIAMYLRDGSNNILQTAIGSSTSGTIMPVFLTKRINISAQTTYKVGVWCQTSGGTVTVNDLYSRGDQINGGAYILARRVP